MATLGSSVALESLVGFTQKLWGHMEIALRSVDIAMSQVGSQLRKQPLYILAFSIPRFDTMLGSGMAKIMQAGLATRSAIADDPGT
jgi:hypothetical protein